MSEQTREAVSMLGDVVGHPAAADADRDGASGAAEGDREAQRELVEKYRGEWIRAGGDGALFTFETAAPRAVSCASEMQRTFANRPGADLRIGVHIVGLVEPIQAGLWWGAATAPLQIIP